jgi:hypothetical protein
MSSSRPTRKRKKMSPTLAKVSRIPRELCGKMFCVKAGMRPNAVGPSNIPATISVHHSSSSRYIRSINVQCTHTKPNLNIQDLLHA